MVAPYRTPATLEPSPDTDTVTCAAPCGCLGVCARPAVLCLHAPCSHAPAAVKGRRARARGGLWTKAVTVSALVLLSGATASVMALAWKVTAAGPADVAAGAHLAPSSATMAEPAKTAKTKWQKPHRRSKRGRPAARAPEKDAKAVLAGAGPSLDLSSLGSPTHAPEDLWARAEKLAAAGVDVVLTETSVASRWVNDLEGALGSAAQIVPNVDFPGIRIVSLAPGSIARAAGLQEGDVVTAVNGHALTSPEVLPAAHASVCQSRAAVVELRRGGRAVVLRLRIRG
jgi:membrane-associated protease RseP (regulator of RpoE activity)